MLFDTHAHLDDEQLAPQTTDVIANAREADCNHILAVAISLSSSRNTVDLASKHEAVYASVGIHPNSCHQTNAGDWDAIVELAGLPKVVALGETGLDGYWDDCPVDLQKQYFGRHIRLSHESGLPFIVHMRDIEDEMIEFLAGSTSSGQLNGIMHSFTGSIGAAEQCLDWGMYISFAGMVTYKKNDELRQVARSIPTDRLLVETDSPYLSPEPVRGKRPNQPAHVRHTLACLAEVRGVSFEDLAEQTTRNAKQCFGIDT